MLLALNSYLTKQVLILIIEGCRLQESTPAGAKCNAKCCRLFSDVLENNLKPAYFSLACRLPIVQVDIKIKKGVQNGKLFGDRWLWFYWFTLG